MNDQTSPASSPAQQPARTINGIAEGILGPITWVSPTQGYCGCPGKKFHTSDNGSRDCVVYLDRVPTLHCMHASCAAEVEKANRKLRAATLNPDNNPEFVMPALTKEDRDRIADRNRDERIRLRAKKCLPQLLKQFRWTCDEILNDSPVDVKADHANHWKLLLNHFEPSDVVWIGGVRDSGSPECAGNFRTVAEWLTFGRAPGQFTCPATFKNSSCGRSNANILIRRFLVVESDVLKRDEVGAVFRWLSECGLKLVAVVDTAGKSLHGWFDFETCEAALDELKLVLPSLGCDPKLFTQSQPVRLPGAERDGKLQRLLYLSGKETI